MNDSTSSAMGRRFDISDFQMKKLDEWISSFAVAHHSEDASCSFAYSVTFTFSPIGRSVVAFIEGGTSELVLDKI
jgi:hypothetical protein